MASSASAWSSGSDTSSSDDVMIPTDEEIQTSIRDLAATVDLEEVSTKKLTKRLSRNLGVTVDDLASKKSFIQECIEQEVKEQAKAKLPPDQEIELAVSVLAKKVDMETTPFKRFLKLLCDEMDVDDLDSKKELIQRLYKEMEKEALPSDSKIKRAAKKLASSDRVNLDTISEPKFLKRLEKKMGVTDLTPKKALVVKILASCKLEYAENHGDDLVQPSILPRSSSTIRRRETSSSLSVPEDLSFHNGPPPPTPPPHAGSPNKSIASATESMTSREGSLLTIPRMDSNNLDSNDDNEDIVDVEDMETPAHPRRSDELPQGRLVPSAKGLTWTDDFFDADFDEKKQLVAVFDHDYTAMFWYEFRVRFFCKILPLFICMITAVLLITMPWMYAPYDLATGWGNAWSYATPNCQWIYDQWGNSYQDCDYDYDVYYGTTRSVTETVRLVRIWLMVVLLIWFSLCVVGNFRIARSRSFALHVAVLADGVRAVHDDHIDSQCCGCLAAFFICDRACIYKTKQVKTVPFDAIDSVTLKNPGEIDDDICCCCKGCCFCCIKIPYHTIGIDTSSSSPKYFSQALHGLYKADRCQKLIWDMKRALVNSMKMTHANNSMSTAALTASMSANNAASMMVFQQMMDSYTGNENDCNVAPNSGNGSGRRPSPLHAQPRPSRSNSSGLVTATPPSSLNSRRNSKTHDDDDDDDKSDESIRSDE